MIKAILFDAGGVLYLNKEGNGYANAPLVDFIKTHRDQFKFGVISDTKYDLKKLLKDDGIFDLFELVLTSGNTDLEKSNPKIYTEVAEQLGFSPQEILLIDNTKDFTDAAHEAGLKVILYTGVTDCLEKLEVITKHEN